MDNEVQRKNILNDSELKYGHFHCQTDLDFGTSEELMITCDNLLIARYVTNEFGILE